MRQGLRNPPLWVRWHERTADLALVRSRLTAAGLPIEEDGDGLWLPLQIAPDNGSATGQIASLVTQVLELYTIAVS
jgi:hypothetical protein